jgi:hypothetical protein
VLVLGIILMGLGALAIGLSDGDGIMLIGAGVWAVGFVLLLAAPTPAGADADARHSAIVQDTQSTYGNRLTVTSYSDYNGNGTDVGFNVDNAGIHCDGKLITNPAGRNTIVHESLTPACQQAETVARG